METKKVFCSILWTINVSFVCFENFECLNLFNLTHQVKVKNFNCILLWCCYKNVVALLKVVLEHIRTINVQRSPTLEITLQTILYLEKNSFIELKLWISRYFRTACRPNLESIRKSDKWYFNSLCIKFFEYNVFWNKTEILNIVNFEFKFKSKKIKEKFWTGIQKILTKKELTHWGSEHNLTFFIQYCRWLWHYVNNCRILYNNLGFDTFFWVLTITANVY